MSATRTSRRPVSFPPPPAGRPAFEGWVDGWRSMPASLVVLRLFLGITFLYAGAQKLLDPNFFRAGSPDYIGTQLRGFAQGSPIAWLLDPLTHLALLAGLAIALVEMAIGIGTLAGVAPRTTAVGGFLLSLSLVLSATWHVHPYFLGSDSVYAVAWAAYFVGYLEHARTSRALGVVGARSRHASSSAIGRRELLRGASLAGATLAAGVVAKALSGTPAGATLAAAGSSTATPLPSASVSGHRHRTASSSSSGDAAPSSPAASASPHVSGTPIAKLSSIPVGGAIGFDGPGNTPAALVRLGRNDVVAYSRVCTHAGCLVGYDQSQRILYCPCHGAEYDPARGAEVIGGPAPRPLPEITVKIDRSTGEVVLPNSA
jgi:thiosulfate dehydrogenase (quinone) large subunit